ncbi:hypothetical protein V6N13_059219 [Hibiscus sabdariffa]
MTCFSCGKYGHNPESCPVQEVSTEDRPTTESVQPMQPSCHETDSCGLWMVVERRQRRVPVKQEPPKVNHANSHIVASRFNPISEENLSEHTTSTDVPPRSHASVDVAKGKGVALHTTRAKKTKSGTSVRKPLSVNGSSVFHFSSNASSSRPVQPLDRHCHLAVIIPDNDDHISANILNIPDMFKFSTQHDPMKQFFTSERTS